MFVGLPVDGLSIRDADLEEHAHPMAPSGGDALNRVEESQLAGLD